MKLSPQQQEIVDFAVEKHQRPFGLVVDAVAGCGKTTLVLNIAKELNTSPTNILLLTYNARLKDESRIRALQEEIPIEIHTYHSFAVAHYDKKCHTDLEMMRFLSNPNSKYPKNLKYDVVVIDEAQDMTPLYFELVTSILRENTPSVPSLIILGDERQSIYQFKGSDSRYISEAHYPFVFGKESRIWKRVTITDSYRIPPCISEFLNTCCFRNFRIYSKKPDNGEKVDYMVTDLYSLSKHIDWNGNSAMNSRKEDGILFKYIMELLEEYSPEDIFILSPSLNSVNSPIKKLENSLKLDPRTKHVPIFVATNEEERLDEDIIRGKLVFSTFHATKGLERKAVVIYGFDDSNFNVIDESDCPNTIYVAVTRAKERLLLLHHSKRNWLSFLNRDNLRSSPYVNLISDTQLSITSYFPDINERETSVTKLLRFLPDVIADKCIQRLSLTTVREKSSTLEIPSKIETENQLFESVSDINGIFTNICFEHFNGETSLSICEELNIPTPTFTDFIQQALSLAIDYWAFRSGYLFKIHQITNHSWINRENLSSLEQRIRSIHLSNPIFEVGVNGTCGVSKGMNVLITGSVDIVDVSLHGDDTIQIDVYEIKCVEMISETHILQLELYKYCIEQQEDLFIDLVIERSNLGVSADKEYDIDMRYFLYNIKTDEKLQIESTKTMKNVREICRSKYNVSHQKESFREINEKIILKNI
jgi:hypothetical protein